MTHQKKLIHNTVANLAGQLMAPVISLAMVPIYLAYLGMEPYGLIGFFSALLLLLGVFSQGITHALQREFARRDHLEGQKSSMRRLALTFERIYGVLGFLAALIIATGAGYISREWVQSQQLDYRTVEMAIYLLALRIAISFPQGVYLSVFIGTQHQVQSNAITITVTLIGAMINLAVVILTRSILGLYIAEVATSMILIMVLRQRAFRILPAPENADPGIFSSQDVRAIAKPSAGIMWTSGIGIIITQIDRVLLSKLVTLAQLAVYNAGIAGGRLISMLYMPFLTAAFPETCQIAATGDRHRLSTHITRNATVVSMLTAAFALPVCFFASDILLVWTRQPVISEEGWRIMVVYILGSLALSNASVFYMLQMALGSVHYSAIYNTVALVWYPPIIRWLIQHYGSEGAAWAWFIYGMITWVFMIAISYARYLELSQLIHYLRRCLTPILLAAGVSTLVHLASQTIIPDRAIWRTMIAGLTAFALLPAGLMLCLGPTESRRILGRLFMQKKNNSAPTDG
ncbi:MAG TPA: oligosaccharide flippase family protein [Kiritimatiellia bacterium]|nr:oligosaccharide flippase family protein [Kiritimatiellia bacterium]